MKNILFLILLFSCFRLGAITTPIINITNQINWDARTFIGVPGGIPNVSTVYTNLTSSINASDAQAAINNCPSNQVVKLGAGTYTWTSGVNIPSGVVLRGSGISTIINASGSPNITGSSGLMPWTNLHSGYTKGSTNLVTKIGSVTPVVGSFIAVWEENNTEIWWNKDNVPTNYMSQLFRVDAVSNGTNLTIWPPLVRNLESSRNPQYTIFTGAWKQRAGIEDLKIVPTGGLSAAIDLSYAYGCWIKGVYITNINNDGIHPYSVLRCEFRSNDIRGNGGGGDGYGIRPEFDSGVGVGCTGIWMEDNIFDGLYHGIFGKRLVASAASYNFSTNEHGPAVAWATAFINMQHAIGGAFALYEGNYGNKVNNDSIDGNCIASVLWRNRFHGLGYTSSPVTKPNYKEAMIWLTTNNLYFSAVGNVLGDTWSTNTWSDQEYSHQDWIDANNDNNGAMWFLGYNGVNPIDAEVSSTMVRYQNFGWFNRTVTNDTTVTDSPAPEASLIYLYKPSFFGSLSWPPIDPTVSNPPPTVIPAGYRYINGTNPPAEIIPPERRITWEGNAGIGKEIPARTTIYTNLSPLGGSINDFTNISVWVARAAASGGEKTVLLGPGIFEGHGTILQLGQNNNVTLRGSGEGSTFLRGGVHSEQMSLHATGELLSSGYTKGSTSIVFSSTPSGNVYPGNLMEIRASDDTNFVFSSSGPGTYMATQTRILTVSGNTVTFNPPLVWDYTGLTPKVHPLISPVGPGITNFGLESLTVTTTNAQFQVAFFGAHGCWLKDVILTNASDIGLYLGSCVRMEVRRSRFLKVEDYPAQPDGQTIVIDTSSYTRIEDNIFKENGVGFLGKDRLSGNVVAFNYFTNAQFNGPIDRQEHGHITTTHGAHSMFYLIEGNILHGVMSDGYHGNESHLTIFRNWIHGLDDIREKNRMCVSLGRGTWTNNVIGNILGDPSWTNATGFAYSQILENIDYSLIQSIYAMGFPSVGNSSFTEPVDVPWLDTYPWFVYPDQTVTNSTTFHGNYDYYTHSQVWDSDITDRNIPNSLLYSSKPSYFRSLNWPPFDPANPQLASPDDIPAGYRFYNNNEDPPESPEEPEEEFYNSTSVVGNVFSKGASIK